MSDFKHLTEFELSAYHNSSLGRNELNEIGRHLLMCSDCRLRMPLPSVEQFWTAVLTDGEPDEIAGQAQSKISTSKVFLSFEASSYGLLLSGGALMLFICLSIVVWLGFAGQPDRERDVAGAFDSNSYVMTPNNAGEQNVSPPVSSPSEKDNAAQSDSKRVIDGGNRAVPASNRRKAEARLTSPKNTVPTAKMRNPIGNGYVISKTRGASNEKCGEAASVLTETQGNAETIRLRWKPVPNAVKYHLYVSDDEEILVDEYETEKETFFVLKKPLDPAKTYKWKIIITLEDGGTIVGEAQKFTVKDLRADQAIIKRQKKSEVRCSGGIRLFER